MVIYRYVAKNTTNGEIVQAEVQAENEQAAAKLLISQQLFPISISDKEEGNLLANMHIGTGISTKTRLIFTRQLSTLINAGLPLLQSLRTVQQQISNKPLQNIVASIITSVEGGSTLSGAFAQHPKVFNKIYISLVEAGETSGSLDKSLQRIAAQQEKDATITSKIRGALIYPVIVLVVILLVLVFMLTTVLPQIAGLYQSLGKPLPFLTRMMQDGSSFILHFWWVVLIALIALGYGLTSFMRTDRGVYLLDLIKLHVPVFGPIFQKIYMARFARTLSALLSTGVPMLQALEVVEQAVGNTLVAATIADSINQVKGGKSLSSTLEGKKTFTILVPQMIGIGEQSGAIDQMLERVAGYYEEEVDEAVATISTIIEPVLMVVLGGLVGLVIASILLPVYSLVGGGINATQ